MPSQTAVVTTEPQLLLARQRTFLRIGLPVLLFLLFFVVAPVLLFGYFVTRTESQGRGEITTAQATAVFAQHRAVCERLRDMLVEDRVLGYFSDEPVTGRRGELYGRLLQEVGAYDLASYPAGFHPYSCEILLGSHGTFLQHTCVAFVFVPDGVIPPDQSPPADDAGGERFVALGDGWFLLRSTM